MKIVCSLRHSELRPLLSTCTRLRQAAAAAISVHFNFCTPEPERCGEEVLAALRSPSPRFVRAAMMLAAEGPAAPRRNRTRRRRPPRAPAPAPALLALPEEEDVSQGGAPAGVASPQPQQAATPASVGAPPPPAAGAAGPAHSPPRYGQRLTFSDARSR